MTVNGKIFDFLSKKIHTIDDLLDHLNLSKNSVAIEKNGSIVDKENWPIEKISSSDSIEIIRFVGGG
ncbi:MAG: sulfur carrier protein ThiS [Leptospiraceae bacterium]|nr:sulfur carrier protein ThiS [Leptospiraceae bacterium]MCK6382106.1 sulfur carrier protein ThiS [Leptospiraceae bacterium]NUM42108.1 sulfur carrier protein ThiS [Leptospiraceae bacterium]